MNSYSVLFVGDHATIQVTVDLAENQNPSEEEIITQAVDLISYYHEINPMHQGFHVDEVIKFQ